MKPPSITETSFNCPHCDALAHQTWFSVALEEIADNLGSVPFVPPDDFQARINARSDLNSEEKAKQIRWLKRIKTGELFLDEEKNWTKRFWNTYVSKCFSCGMYSVWTERKLTYPVKSFNVTPNNDMPQNIKLVFNEARSIVDQSPRGAAALLRLCIQLLCIELGGVGKNIDDDIGTFVKTGKINALITKALDAVRVIGNESVHPGMININDDARIAHGLFTAVNVIVEQMISSPKTIADLHSLIPPNKLAAIERRDNPKPPQP